MRSSQHSMAQKHGKERDFYTCQICGSTDNVEGHHIVNYQYGGSASVDNIMSLCRDCHNSVHKGLIDLIVF